MQKVKDKITRFKTLEWKQTDGRTDGRTDEGDCITSRANAVSKNSFTLKQQSLSTKEFYFLHVPTS